jgi:CheY-like chemotaxis protein
MPAKIVLIDRLARAVFPPESILSRQEKVVSLLSSNGDARMVLFEYSLPDMTAPDFCRSVRQGAESKSASLLFIGDYDHASEAELCLAAGCNDFVLRPLDTAQLDAKIERLSSIPIRKELRTMTRLQLRVDNAGDRFTGHSINISTTGMLLQVNAVFPPEAFIRIHFYLQSDAEPVDVMAKVVRAEFTGGAPRYGVLFIDPDASVTNRILRFIEGRRG